MMADESKCALRFPLPESEQEDGTSFIWHDVEPLAFWHDATLSEWISSCLSKRGCSDFSLSYIFCRDDYLLEINRKYLDHDFYTDIITFPLSEHNHIYLTGEIYISVDRVTENAHIREIEVQQELLRVISHGFLHLLGLNDHSEEEKKIMRAAEDACLEHFKEW